MVPALGDPQMHRGRPRRQCPGYGLRPVGPGPLNRLAIGRPPARDRPNASVVASPDGSVVVHVDLAPISKHGCSEMTIDGRGNIYVNSIGFDFSAEMTKQVKDTVEIARLRIMASSPRTGRRGRSRMQSLSLMAS